MASMATLLMPIKSMIMYVLKCRAWVHVLTARTNVGYCQHKPIKNSRPTSSLENNNEIWSNFWMAIS